MTTEPLARVDPADFATSPTTRSPRSTPRPRRADGHDALGDAVWRDLAHPAPTRSGFLVDGRAYVHVARGDDERSRRVGPRASSGSPAKRDAGAIAALLDAAVAHVAAHGGGALDVLGVRRDRRRRRRVRRRRVSSRRGTLYEMRAPLPLAATPRVAADGVTVRDVRARPRRRRVARASTTARSPATPSRAAGPRRRCARRMAEPWFDPTLFLLAFDADGLAGFNWLKVHDAATARPARSARST